MCSDLKKILKEKNYSLITLLAVIFLKNIDQISMTEKCIYVQLEI